MNYEKAVSNIRKELKAYIEKWKIQSLVIGISGGIDSCLCAVLAKVVCEELNIPLIGRSLPITTNTQDEINRADLIGRVFCSNFRRENLDEIFNKLSIINPDPIYSYIESIDIRGLSDKQITKEWKIRNGNIKARLRMIYLYNTASQNRLVLSTDNYTEYLLGFSTIMGDWGDFGMIQYLWKTEVYEMSEWIANNECKFLDQQEALMSTIEAMATDGLGVSNLGDLGQILPEWKGNSRDGYVEVDKILQQMESISIRNPHHELDNHPVILRHLNSQFKRDWPITIKRNKILAIQEDVL